MIEISDKKESVQYHKQAVCITAYRGFGQLKRLADMMSSVFEVYVHIDKRVPDYEWKKYGLEEKEHVRIYSLYKIYWGGGNHLKAILYLMNEALRNKDISYLHIISGEDWPVRNIKDIYGRFIDERSVYMAFDKLNDMGRKEYNYVSKWQKYYSFLDIFNYKSIPQKIFVKLLVLFQKVIGIDRFSQLDIDLARGIVWGGLPRDAVRYCMDYLYKNPEFMNFLQYGHAAEEFFFQTILLASEYWREKIINDNLRYIIYEKRNGSYPAVLDMSDVEKIAAGDYIFARKMRDTTSAQLMSELNHIYKNG